MPEEENRIIADHVSDILFAVNKECASNLSMEGISWKKIFVTGDTMIDCLKRHLHEINSSKILSGLEVEKQKFFLLTLHRQSNADSEKNLEKIIKLVGILQKGSTVVFPVHPRTMKKIKSFGLDERLYSMPNVKILKPLDYFDFTKLLMESKAVLSDSGSIQSEASFLNVPEIILREKTERQFLLEKNFAVLTGIKIKKIVKEIDCIARRMKNPKQKLFDGKAGKRIAKIIERRLDDCRTVSRG